MGTTAWVEVVLLAAVMQGMGIRAMGAGMQAQQQGQPDQEGAAGLGQHLCQVLMVMVMGLLREQQQA